MTLMTIAGDALDIADQLDWDRFAVIGHSMGGKAALRLATLAHERVSWIVGLAPVWASSLPLALEQLAVWKSSVASVDVRKTLISATVGNLLTQHWCRKAAENSLLMSRPEAYLDYFRSFSSNDFEAEAVELDHEMLVIVGATDVVTTKRAREMWACQTSSV